MKKFLLILVAIAILNIPVYSQGGPGDDPGLPDSLIIECDSLIVGRSMPITIRIVNDDPLRTIFATFNFVFDYGAAMKFDSIKYINYLLDPSVLDFRSSRASDTTFDVFYHKITGNDLPAGGSNIMQFYYTASSPGKVEIDTMGIPPSYDYAFFAQLPEKYIGYEPNFLKKEIKIVDGTPFPIVNIINNQLTTIAGEPTSTEIILSSSAGYPTNLTLNDFTKYDNSTTTANLPIISHGVNYTFEWTPSYDDIGIWKAVIEGCDSSGTCVTSEIIIQVLESQDFIAELSLKVIPDFHQPEEMIWEDIDNDLYPEILTIGYNNELNSTFATYDFDYINHALNDVTVSPDRAPYRSHILLGYIDSDNYLDAVYPTTSSSNLLSVIPGTGSLEFDFDNIYATPTSIAVSRHATLNDFNHDGFLDYAASGFNTVVIYNGQGTGYFTESFHIELSETIRSLNSADFNTNGKNDIAIGTDAGVYIYHNLGNGTFQFNDFYPQSYGTVDIDITNDGSDFNGDRYFDFVISTPSVGGEFSEIVLYQGKPNGTFDVVPVRTLKGQVFGNAIADFNNDNNLDIAFVNGAFKYIGILYGDGNGNFVNEQRFYISDISLFTINCVDFDLDGDVDISCVGTDNAKDGTLFLLENKDNSMLSTSQSFELEVLNNANLQMTSPNGKILNDVSSSFSASSTYLKSIDNNTQIDKVYSLKTVEDGAYRIEVDPKINLPVGELFSIEFSTDNEQFSLAKNIPMSQEGYTFVVYPSGVSPVNPIPGQFTGEKSPLFAWDISGDVNFQLASDIDFTNIIHESVVSAQHLQYTSELPTDDTTPYYWRVKQISNPSYDVIYVFNLFEKVPTGLDDDDMYRPELFTLAQNYPNPFNPTTQLSFSLPEKSFVSMNIFNIAGQKIKTLANREFSVGIHFVEWDGTNASGEKAATGIYLMKLTTDKNFSKSIKMLMMK